ncbi:hypothetical protein EV356DRAFT_509360, partial [Viridothelium virens]
MKAQLLVYIPILTHRKNTNSGTTSNQHAYGYSLEIPHVAERSRDRVKQPPPALSSLQRDGACRFPAMPDTVQGGDGGGGGGGGGWANNRRARTITTTTTL